MGMPSLFLTCYERTAFLLTLEKLNILHFFRSHSKRPDVTLNKQYNFVRRFEFKHKIKQNILPIALKNVFGVCCCCVPVCSLITQPTICDNTMYFSVLLVHDFHSLTLYGLFSVSAVLLPLTYVWVWARFSEWSYDFLTGFQFLLPHTISLLTYC